MRHRAEVLPPPPVLLSSAVVRTVPRAVSGGRTWDEEIDVTRGSAKVRPRTGSVGKLSPGRAVLRPCEAWPTPRRLDASDASAEASVAVFGRFGTEAFGSVRRMESREGRGVVDESGRGSLVSGH